jgi:hypothetical protein
MQMMTSSFETFRGQFFQALHDNYCQRFPCTDVLGAARELRLLFVYAVLCLFLIACFRDIACSHFKVIALVCSIFCCTCQVVYVASN